MYLILSTILKSRQRIKSEWKNMPMKRTFNLKSYNNPLKFKKNAGNIISAYSIVCENENDEGKCI